MTPEIYHILDRTVPRNKKFANANDPGPGKYSTYCFPTNTKYTTCLSMREWCMENIFLDSTHTHTLHLDTTCVFICFHIVRYKTKTTPYIN